MRDLLLVGLRHADQRGGLLRKRAPKTSQPEVGEIKCRPGSRLLRNSAGQNGALVCSARTIERDSRGRGRQLAASNDGVSEVCVLEEGFGEVALY